MELPAMIDIDGCKTIEELAHRVINEYEYNGKTIREWADLLTNQKTNADRIRAMKEEELADFLADLAYSHCPKHGARCCVGSCRDCLKNWLREDVKEE